MRLVISQSEDDILKYCFKFDLPLVFIKEITEAKFKEIVAEVPQAVVATI
jgi:hypothetical protein